MLALVLAFAKIRQCELVDTRSSKPEATIWGHSFGIVVNELVSSGMRNIVRESSHPLHRNSKRFFDEGNRS